MIRRARLALAVLLLATPLPAEWKGPPQPEVRLGGDGQGWLVRVTVNGTVDGLFLLDTGASVCVLTAATAQRLRLPPASRDIGLRTANGTIRVPLVHVGSIEVGGNRAQNVAAVIHEAVAPPLAGVLGLSYLNHFSYQVDSRRRVLRLQ